MTQEKDTTSWLRDLAAGWEAKLAALPAAERQLYGAILQAFLTQGRPPDAAHVHTAATAAGVNPTAALAALAARDLIVTDASTGSVSAAYPFSGPPTAHQVVIDGGQAVSAMCAVDALGIPFMLERAVTVVSHEPTSGEPIRIRIEPATGRVEAAPAGVVVFVGNIGGEGPACERACPFVNFFRSAASVAHYRTAHPGLAGRIVSLTDAIAAGKHVFANRSHDLLPTAPDLP